MMREATEVVITKKLHTAPLGRMSELHCTGARKKKRLLENTTLDFSECSLGHDPHEISASDALDSAKETNIKKLGQ